MQQLKQRFLSQQALYWRWENMNRNKKYGTIGIISDEAIIEEYWKYKVYWYHLDNGFYLFASGMIEKHLFILNIYIFIMTAFLKSLISIWQQIINLAMIKIRYFHWSRISFGLDLNETKTYKIFVITIKIIPFHSKIVDQLSCMWQEMF
jgi:hypothetical protein